MTAVERFWALFSDTLLPRYLEENGYEPGGLVDDKIVAESDAEWFIAAVRSGLADPLPRGEYWLPASRYRASPFWELGTKTKPEQITLWVEGLVTIATAARLHFLYGWPKETLGFESEDYAFDLIGRLPGRAHEYLAGEAKASTANLAALIADITSCAEKGEHDEASHTKAERNAHKKWAGLCRSRAPVLFVFGPDRAATIFRVSYPSRFGVRFESAGDDALEYPGITARGDSLERSIVINASKSESETRTVWGYRRANGDLQVVDQTLGSDVERAFGAGIREREWILTVKAPHVSLATKALETSAYEDILDVLSRRWAGDRIKDIAPRLQKKGVPFETWVRVGD